MPLPLPDAGPPDGQPRVRYQSDRIESQVGNLTYEEVSDSVGIDLKDLTGKEGSEEKKENVGPRKKTNHG
jgi:hypothetical protein